MVIRSAKKADLPALAELHVVTWQVAYRDILPAELIESLSAARTEARWAELFNDPQRTTLIAEINGQVAGFVGFGASRDEDDSPHKVGEIYALYVHPNWWGNGSGTALVEQAFKQLRQKGFQEVTVWTLTRNSPARTFYEKVGFIFDGATKEDSWQDVKFSEVRYRQQIL